MKIINKSAVEPILDACGKLKEMYNSENLSISYAEIEKETKAHKHVKTEEIYYIVKGEGVIRIEDKNFAIKMGDIFSIPKNKYHQIVSVKERLEIIVVTNPKFDQKDIFF